MFIMFQMKQNQKTSCKYFFWFPFNNVKPICFDKWISYYIVLGDSWVGGGKKLRVDGK